MSDKDVFKIVLYGAHEIRARTPFGITFSMRAGEGDLKNDLAFDYFFAKKKIKDEAQTYAMLNSNSEEERNMIYSNMVKEKLNDWLVANVSKYGYVYTIEKRGI